MQLTERLIQNRLWTAWGRVTGTLLVPNYTPAGWYECDLFYVTAAGYMREYEIKLTWADFVIDRDKGCHRGNKHQLLEVGHPQGPRQFSYVVPNCLVGADQVPPYAGLIWIWGPSGVVDVVKKAPILHSEKVRQTVLTHARGVCYYRMWNERMRNGR